MNHWYNNVLNNEERLEINFGVDSIINGAVMKAAKRKYDELVSKNKSNDGKLNNVFIQQKRKIVEKKDTSQNILFIFPFRLYDKELEEVSMNLNELRDAISSPDIDCDDLLLIKSIERNNFATIKQEHLECLEPLNF